MRYSPSDAASCLKHSGTMTGPKDPGPPAKYAGRAQPHKGTGMGYNPAQAAKCLDGQGAPGKDGPMTLKGY